jgi:hypothetical protein
MNVRPYVPSDLERLKQLHAGCDYELPDPYNPLVLVSECGVDEKEIIRVAGIARMELNVTLLLDHGWSTPEARLDAVRKLQHMMNWKSSILGLDWAYAEANQRFGKRLEELNWIPARDKLYFLRIN